MRYKIMKKDGVYEILRECPDTEQYYRHGRKYPTSRSLRSRLEQMSASDIIEIDKNTIAIDSSEYLTLLNNSLRRL